MKRTVEEAFGTPPSIFRIRDRVKSLQENDPEAREQWLAFCKEFGEGNYDSSNHDEHFISSFIAQYQLGRRLPTSSEANELPSEANELPNMTKVLQKKSAPFRWVWDFFCSTSEFGDNDLDRIDPTFHVQFYEFLAEHATRSIKTSRGAGQAEAAAKSAGAGTSMEAGTSTETGMGADATGDDPDKAKLVQQIKLFLAKGEAQKEAWRGFCEKHLGGTRDPARHELAILLNFAMAYGLCSAADCVGHVEMDLGSGGASPAPPATEGTDPTWAQKDAVKKTFVERIKAFQRADLQKKEAWYNFCGKQKDPARHDVAKLQQFINDFGVP